MNSKLPPIMDVFRSAAILQCIGLTLQTTKLHVVIDVHAITRCNAIKIPYFIVSFQVLFRVFSWELPFN